MRVSCRYAGILAYLMSGTRRKLRKQRNCDNANEVRILLLWLGQVLSRCSLDFHSSFPQTSSYQTLSHSLLRSIRRCEHTNASDKFTKNDMHMWTGACQYMCMFVCMRKPVQSRSHRLHNELKKLFATHPTELKSGTNYPKLFIHTPANSNTIP